MSLAITEEHRDLGRIVRDFAAKNDLTRRGRAAFEQAAAATSGARRDSAGPDGAGADVVGTDGIGQGALGLDGSLGAMASLGWTGLHLPAEVGGSGFGLAELVVVLDELGAAVAPGPFLAGVIGSAIINATGDDELREQLLPGAAAGTSVIAYGIADELDVHGWGAAGTRMAGAAGPPLSARGHVASGRVARVAGGAWADHLLIGRGADLLVIPVGDPPGAAVAKEEGRAAGTVTRTALDALDPGMGLAAFDLDRTAVKIIRGAAPTALAIARALAAASAAGGARAATEMATGYAKVREQFGRTIGSFQAVKHLLADMLADSELATAAAWDAARAADHAQDEQAELCAAVAATIALTGFQRNAQRCIQVHGGIGFTWEHDAHLYLRRALTLLATFGPETTAQDDVARLVAAGVRRDRAVDLPAEAESFRPAVREFRAALEAAPAQDRRGLWARSRYLVPHWPLPWGRAASPVEQLVIEEELAGLARPSMGIGEWIVLTITSHGTPEQLERWIWPSLRGELVWCQLFSEPGAGSDAAGVQTKATKVDGGWRVTGQKVWTSGAQFCNRGLATVRTDPEAPKHKGITTLVIDLKSPGVDVRPLREITGDAMFNEVFFDDVFVPDCDVVGAVNSGWGVARTTLGNERVSIGGGLMAGAAFEVVPLLSKYAAADTGLWREAGRLLADELALSAINLRQVARAVVGAQPGPEGAVTKVITSQHLQRGSELAMRVLGPAGVDGSEPRPATSYLLVRSMTIAGGTTEIGKNVIAERILGLPRDPLVR
jgi:alkylation response protein AidB-like acyl-CoA dehydrogenase